MSDTAQIEKGRRLGVKLEVPNQPPRVISIPDEEHTKIVTKVSSHLAQAGHPQTPDQVSAHGVADAHLSKMARDHPAIEVLTDATHRLKRFGGNMVGDLSGSNHIYTVERQTGHETALSRVHKMADLAGTAKRIINYLPWRKKAA